MAGVEAAQWRLLEVEVQLDLVHGRDDVRLVEQPLQVRHLEVGDPDGADPPVRVELLERAPGVHVAVTTSGLSRKKSSRSSNVS